MKNNTLLELKAKINRRYDMRFIRMQINVTRIPGISLCFVIDYELYLYKWKNIYFHIFFQHSIRIFFLFFILVCIDLIFKENLYFEPRRTIWKFDYGYLNGRFQNMLKLKLWKEFKSRKLISFSYQTNGV